MNHQKNTFFTQRNQDHNKQSKFRLMPRVKTQFTEAKGSIPKTKMILQKNGKGSKKHIRFVSELTKGDYEKQTLHIIKQLEHNRLYDKMIRHKINTKQAQKQDVKIFRQYIQNLKNRNTKYHKKAITFSLLNFKIQSLNIRNSQNNQPMEKHKYSQCCNLIDIIFKKIKNLKEIGYSESKINEWILHFCDSTKPYFKEIFMKNTNKSVYNFNEHYQYEKSQKIVEQRIKFKIEKKKDSYTYVELQELRQFANYIQEILIQKNNIKIEEIQSSILQKMSKTLIQKLKNKEFVFNRQSPLQINNFTNQLNLYQKKYGNFQEFSKINKLRFQKLNQVQNNIKDHYHDVIDGNAKSIKSSKQYFNSLTTTI